MSRRWPLAVIVVATLLSGCAHVNDWASDIQSHEEAAPDWSVAVEPAADGSGIAHEVVSPMAAAFAAAYACVAKCVGDGENASTDAMLRTTPPRPAARKARTAARLLYAIDVTLTSSV